MVLETPLLIAHCPLQPANEQTPLPQVVKAMGLMLSFGWGILSGHSLWAAVLGARGGPAGAAGGHPVVSAPVGGAWRLGDPLSVLPLVPR